MSKPTPNADLHPLEAAARQRVNIIRLIRAAFLVLTVTFTLLSILRPAQDDLSRMLAEQWWIPLCFSLALFGFALGVDLLTPRKKIATLTGVVVGVMVGMLATLALGFIIELLLKTWMEERAVKALEPVVSAMKILLGITLCYLGVTTVLQTQDDFRLVIPYVEFAKQLRGVRAILVDTSVLIDGRIADIAATGFLQSSLVIHRSVIGELQLLADSTDALTRNKGRRGLDLIARLQRAPRLDVTIDDTPVQQKAVDAALVELARSMGALIMTTDSGLARVASIQSVQVLNLNELANAMKLSLVAGESVTVRLLRQGEQAGQAVGYLPDGTMVVAEDGQPHIGETVTLTVQSSLQTAAGRMIFARLVPDEADVAPTAESPAEQPSAEPSADAAPADAAPAEPDRARSPFPPRPPASIRTGTPRNPRR